MIKIRIDNAVKCNGDVSLFVSFPYDTKIIDTVRSFPTRYWMPDNKCWEVPFNKLGELVDKLPEYDFDITGSYVSLEKPEAKMPAGFEFKTTPFQHQIEGFNYGLQNDRWLLGDEMGLGKTKQVIDIALAKKLQKGYQHCLIICGVNGLKWNWMNEIQIHSNETGYILGTRKDRIGSNADKLADLTALASISSYFIITNVESLRDEKIAAKIAELCATKTIGMIAADEVHKMKNPASQQGKAFLKIQPECRIAMTGTPLMNTPLDLYIILKWLGYENHSFYAFRNHYCEMGGYGGYQIVGYKHLNELQERLDDVMLRRLKKDVLDLPEKTYIEEFVEMSAHQWTIYNEVTKEVKENIDQIKCANNPLAELIRMRQATGYTGILSSTVQESAKLDRMVEIIEDSISNGKQVVVFSNWTQITDEVRNRLNGFRYGVITGQTKDEERQQIVNKFQAGEYKVVVGTIGAMGTGITLTAGTVEIFLDEPWNRANKEQAEDRCHRAGTKENVTIYTLLCKGTIDERIHELVYEKGAMADALVDGKTNMSKPELLDFLLS